MDLEKPIAVGRTAKVYNWEKNRILKLYNKGWNVNDVNYEYQISRKVFDLGLQVPEVFEMTELNGQTGIIFERLEGKSMLQVMKAKPFKIRKYGQELADLAFSMHKLEMEGLPSLSHNIQNSIRSGNWLTDEEMEIVSDQLSSMPDYNYLCHGDFHPDNVLMTDNGPRIIDWITVCQGDPVADFVRTLVLLQIGTPPSGFIDRTFTRIFRSLFYNSFYKHYIKISDVNSEIIDRWMLPVLVNRLNDDRIPEERNQLLEMIRKCIANLN